MHHSADAVPLIGVDESRLDGNQNPVTAARRSNDRLSDVIVGIDRLDGKRLWMSGSCSPLRPDDPEHSRLIVSFTDITDRHATMQQLIYEAAHDPMTGLANRNEAIKRVHEALENDGPAGPADSSADSCPLESGAPPAEPVLVSDLAVSDLRLGPPPDSGDAPLPESDSGVATAAPAPSIAIHIPAADIAAVPHLQNLYVTPSRTAPHADSTDRIARDLYDDLTE